MIPRARLVVPYCWDTWEASSRLLPKYYQGMQGVVKQVPKPCRTWVECANESVNITFPRQWYVEFQQLQKWHEEYAFACSCVFCSCNALLQSSCGNQTSVRRELACNHFSPTLYQTLLEVDKDMLRNCRIHFFVICKLASPPTGTCLLKTWPWPHLLLRLLHVLAGQFPPRVAFCLRPMHSSSVRTAHPFSWTSHFVNSRERSSKTRSDGVMKDNRLR